jgi:hypothetical protein
VREAGELAADASTNHLALQDLCSLVCCPLQICLPNAQRSFNHHHH